METNVWEEVGLSEQEYELITDLLEREPNNVELEVFGVMWSEHCSYKSSRPVLKKFPTEGTQVLQGPGENAGVVDIGDDLGIAFKLESHNSPSAVEPYQGAATGVGGIVRDIFTMGARPIALLDSLRIGTLGSAHARHIFAGVVAGIGGYGNRLGIPTVGGETYFHPSYERNPLVNAMCVGLVEHKDLTKGIVTGAGNPVMIVGAATGKDGIRGASFSSGELGEDADIKPPTVQAGDPFLEKVLLEACLELIKTGNVIGMQDMGAAGLTSSSCEMAAKGDSGIEIDVALVPRREEGMTPDEVLISESQERMLVVPKKGKEDQVKRIFNKWGLNATVIGMVTDDGIWRVKEGQEIVAEIPAKFLTEECPLYEKEAKEPDYIKDVQNCDLQDLTEPENYKKIFLDLLGRQTIASKEWIYSQFDHTVGSNTIVKPGSDAAVVRIKGTNKAIALSTDCNSRYVYLDPFTGGKIAVSEAARNIVCSGAKPLGASNCLNFGNPDKPEIFWQLKESARGISEACSKLDTPITGGNVSLYNETDGEGIFPTPVIGMVGLLKNAEKSCTLAFKNSGDTILLLGENKDELGGSEFLSMFHGLEAGMPPSLDLEREKNLQDCTLELIESGLVKSAHDTSEGGLSIALAECAMANNLGAEITLDSDIRPSALLFGETQSRIIISVDPKNQELVKDIANQFNLPVSTLGKVKESGFEIKASNFEIKASLKEMTEKYKEAIPCVMKN